MNLLLDTDIEEILDFVDYYLEENNSFLKRKFAGNKLFTSFHSINIMYPMRELTLPVAAKYSN